MATTIFDLSNELLAEVVKYLAKYRRSILASTLTSRKISPIAQEALYRDIELVLSKLCLRQISCRGFCLSDANISFRGSSLWLLLQAWHCNPTLLLQRLNSFAIHPWSTNGYEVHWLVGTLAGAKALKTLKIYSCNTTRRRDFTSTFPSRAYWMFPSLEDLEMNLSDVNTTNYRLLQRGVQKPMVDDIMPRKLDKRLSFVRQTLRYLKIANSHAVFPGHNIRQINLSTFECLEDLQISSVLFFGNASCMKIAPKANIARLIPPTLKTISIYFDTLPGIFHSSRAAYIANDHIRNRFTNRNWSELWQKGPGSRSTIAKSFCWLYALSDQCKCLKQFRMEETDGKSWEVSVMKHLRNWVMESFVSVDVVHYHASFFAELPFQCNVSVSVHPGWWQFEGYELARNLASKS